MSIPSVRDFTCLCDDAAWSVMSRYSMVCGHLQIRWTFFFFKIVKWNGVNRSSSFWVGVWRKRPWGLPDSEWKGVNNRSVGSDQ